MLTLTKLTLTKMMKLMLTKSNALILETSFYIFLVFLMMDGLLLFFV